MIRSARALTASSYLSMFFLGVSAALVGAAARNIGLSAYQIGLLIAAQQLGFVLSVGVSGALSDSYEKPKILLIGSLILGFAFLTFYRSDLFGINLLIMFLIGAGAATYEGVTDAMLLDIYTERQGFYINVNHFFVTLGSILITLYLLFLQMNWRQAAVQSGVVVLLLAGFFAVTRLKSRQVGTGGYLRQLQALARDRILVALCAATVLAVGVELGSIGILTTYLAELRGFSQTTSKIGLIVFLTGMASGRLFLGFFAQKGKIPQLILALLGLSCMFFAGLFLLDLGRLTYAAILLAGASLSALLPLMITLSGVLHPEATGMVLAFIKVAAGLGGILLPFCMSLIVKAVSFQASLLLFPVVLLLAFCVLFPQLRRIGPVEPVSIPRPVD